MTYKLTLDTGTVNGNNRTFGGVFVNPADNLFYRTLTISLTGTNTTTAYPFNLFLQFQNLRLHEHFNTRVASLNEQFTLPLSSRIEISGNLQGLNQNNFNGFRPYETRLSEVQPPGTYMCRFETFGLSRPQLPFGLTDRNMNYSCYSTFRLAVFDLLLPTILKFGPNLENKIVLTYSNPAII